MSQFNYLPSEQVKDIQQIRADSNKSAADLSKDFTEGINQSGYTPDKRGSPEMFGLNDNQAVMDAIERRGQQKYRSNVGQIKSNADIEALNSRFTRLNQAAELTAAELQHNQMVKAARHAEKMNRRRARAGVLGNVLGIAGAVVGGVYGGPAGASAGYMIGQGVGGMAGEGM